MSLIRNRYLAKEVEAYLEVKYKSPEHQAKMLPKMRAVLFLVGSASHILIPAGRSDCPVRS